MHDEGGRLRSRMLHAGRRGVDLVFAARPPTPPTPRQPGALGFLRTLAAEIAADNLSIVAAGVAFYAILTIFPALAVLVSLYGLVADPAEVERQAALLDGILPDAALQLLTSGMRRVASRGNSQLTTSLLVGLALSSWSARVGAGALVRALNIAFDVEERRSLFAQQAMAFGLTAAGILFGAVALALVAIVPAVIDLLPVPDGWRHFVAWVRWPILGACVVFGLAFLYRVGPDRREESWRDAVIGGVAAAGLWLLVSVGFSHYVAAFGRYDETYGPLGAAIVLLLWFYLSAFILLVGAEIASLAADAHAPREP